MSDLIDVFAQKINADSGVTGDLLEFGTGHGHSTSRIADVFNKGKIYTFDGFNGLPKTNKVIPRGTGWDEGALQSNEQVTRQTLAPYANVIVEKCMTWDLKEPIEYGITKISGVNVDVDLYEGTKDALNFMDKCEWKEVIIRFDDWGYYRDTLQIKEEVEEHEKAAFFEFVNEKGYAHSFYDSDNATTDHRQVIVKVYR